MDVVEHYRALIRNTDTVVGMMAGANGASEALTASHNYLLDYDALKMAIAERPEASVLDSAVKEYQFALFALVSGQYRHAFGGLRLFFELMLATVQFSAHEIDYRMWAKDSKDINWSALKDAQSGVFSVNFIRAFNPGFSDCAKQYLAIAEVVYRECSEFVHGNAGTHAILPSDIEFQEEAFFSWHEKAATMRLAIIFVFSARYLNYVTKEAAERMEPIITDVLGNLPPVQAIFSQPSEA
ncbi:hypothetical protein AWB69_00726 [Caballeronia udeis]|uniref:Uncharacterized protein n=1 Tax=Caballeronia udeis TaxID=1232866 RepID=A0A158F7V6_9BURK|nr:hypothetical protein [Caballeronia udeis]SAL15439.1 hypothetical protein AWB69_00726 [Caballeronia udeis]